MRPFLFSSCGVLAVTAVGVALASVDPSLAESVRPHPVLTGSMADAFSILGNNLRVLAAPFLAIVLGFPESRLGRGVGDAVTALAIAVNGIPVGLALGRWGDALLPYVPQLPLEWAALAIAAAAWCHARSGAGARRVIAAAAATTAVLLVAAAAIETWVTPPRTVSQVSAVEAGTHG